LRNKTLAVSFLMVLGCAKGVEIDLQEVVILPTLPPGAADASVDGGEPLTTTGEVSPAPAVVTSTPAVVQAPNTTPDVAAMDASTSDGQ
jgi:hypothetical protein